MPTLSQLSANRATLTIPLSDGESLHITYKPGSVTPRALRVARSIHEGDDFNALSEDEQQRQLDTMTATLAGMVLSWDLTNDDGQPVAPTVAGLEDVDYETQGWLLTKIIEHQRLGEPTGAQRSKRSSSRT